MSSHLSERSVLMRRMIWAMLAVGLIGVAGWFTISVYPNLPRGAEWGVFRRKIDPLLKAKIDSRMGEIAARYPAPPTAQMDRILAGWDSKPLRDELGTMGLAALPYIEAKARSRDRRVRLTALRMLASVSPSCTPESKRVVVEIDKEEEWRLKLRYVYPVYERALCDVMPKARWLALAHWNKDYYGSRGLDLLLPLRHDLDREVRVWAARCIMGAYKRPDLVPGWLKRESRRMDVM